MMYLVLTAMLALNVSKDILNAFVIVNSTVEQTNKNFGEKMTTTYGVFKDAMDAAPDKVGPYYKKAEKIRDITDDLVNYMANMKDELFSEVDNVPLEEVKADGKSLPELSAKDNISKATQFFIKDKKKGEEMAKKFREYKQNLVKIVDDSTFTINNQIFAVGLQVDSTYPKGAVIQNWVEHNFEGTVAAACYTLLNKTIGEIRNMEYETVNYLFSSINRASHKFDNVSAKVIPNSRIVFQGGAYEAEVIVAAYDSKQAPIGYYTMGRDSVSIDMISSLTSQKGEEGIVKLRFPATSIGDQKFAGVIELVGPDGKPSYNYFNSSYTVTKAASSIAADMMNVFYAGIPNPVTIAAPLPPERLQIDWGGATVTRSPEGAGKFDVTVPSTLVGREVTIKVSARVEGGQTQAMGQASFRVKAVPEPGVFVAGNIQGGKQPKDALLANAFVSATMDQSFNYRLPWKVLSYKVTFVRNGVEAAPIMVNGAQFSDQVRSGIQNASSGTIVEFSEIKIQSIAGTRNIQKTIMIRIR
ncbi:MAG: gliding motility protein GldM [Lentimicrobiaceae bacterium]|nr:gliding motility protein GldM [Lentimicrobiaceae bacterium]